MSELEEEHKSNGSGHEEQFQKTKVSPLAFAEPLPEDEPDYIYEIENQNVVFG